MSVPVRRIALAAMSATALLAALTACTSGSAASSSTSSAAATTGSTTAPTSASAQVTVPDTGAAGSSSSSSLAPSTSTVITSTSTSALPKAVVTASPAFGSANLSPVAPIKITVANGTLASLAMTNAEGKTVTGTLSKDKTSWTPSEVLGYGKTYTVSGTADGAAGDIAIKGTYTTVTPSDEVTTSISPGDGAEVGIAQPVIVNFGYKVSDPAAVMAAMKITTTPQVEGAWAWVQHDGQDYPSLDWRPKDYWPAGTKVHVESNIYGIPFADDLYGGDDKTVDFTIGRAQVVYADATKYNIVVKRGCTKMNDPGSCTSTVATYDGSYGSGDEIGDPNRVTRSGIHVVVDMQPTVLMSNPAYGYTNSKEYWAVRISDNGEFIHENPNTVGDQGNTNVSHGCINLSPESAEAYYDSAMIGDPVEVTGTSVQLSKADGDLYDWTIPWADWTKMTDPSDA
jgi:lipoprotein-anchoring transpeptidase ErfK/SrfK